LNDFYFGANQDGLKQQLLDNISVSSADISTFPLGKPQPTPDNPAPENVVVRVYSEATLVQQGEQRKASVPDDLPPDELTLERALELLSAASVGDTPLGVCPNTGREVYVKSGRFGPYVQLAVSDPDGKEKPVNASLLKGMEVGDVTLEIALQLLSLPRNLGVYEALGEPVLAYNGRFGPYVKCGAETRTIPANLSLLDINLEQASELLQKPRFGGRAAAKEPLKVLAASPVTGQEIKLLEGRYGPYLTDGETNASLPKTMAPETVTMEVALQLLAERAAAGGSKKPAGRGRGGKRATGKAAPKSATSKSAAPSAGKKKPAKKKTTKKKT
jgi:DNA topoisomerase-1